MRKDLTSRCFAVMTAAVIFSVQSISAYGEDYDTMPDFSVAVNMPPQILFLGDSIAAGYGLEGYSAEDKSQCASYANILSEVFESGLPDAAMFDSQNAAKDGRTSGELLEQLRSGTLDRTLVQADAVVVSIGGNDLLGTFLELFEEEDSWENVLNKLVSFESKLDEDLKGFEENMPLIAEELSARTNAKIFVQTLYNPLESTFLPLLNDLSAKKINKLNNTIVETCENTGAYVVCDVASAFAGRSEELTNINSYDIHPNAAGHMEIAKVLQPIIENYTYKYYDYEARALWSAKAAEERKKAEQRKRKILIVSSAAAIISGGSLTTVLVRRKKRF